MRLFKPDPLLPLWLLATSEVAAFALAPVAASLLLGVRLAPPIVATAVIFATTNGVTMLSMGLYSRRQRARLLGIILRVGAAIVIGSAAIGVLSYLAPPIAIERRVFLLAVACALVAVTLLRFALDRTLGQDAFRRRVLVYGAGRRALAISQLRRRADLRGFKVVGYVATEGDQVTISPEQLVDSGARLLNYCREQAIDEVVVAMDDRRRQFPMHELLDCRLAGIDVLDIIDFLERETGKVRLDVLNPSWIIFAPGFRLSPWRRRSARALDVAASFTVLLIVWPVMLLTAIAIWLEDGWRAPILYGQTRVGLEGAPFRVLKFRSMQLDAERHGPRWASKDDPRVTRVGSFIRRVRIDELPQVLNVLAGSMSLVGPRPERPEFVAALEERVPYYRERHWVKPGITGWAQLCYPYGSTEQDAAEKLQYDLYYVKNNSLLFDLMILLQTVEVVLLGKGAR